MDEKRAPRGIDIGGSIWGLSASIPILNRSWTLTRVLAIVVLIAFIIAAYAIPLSLYYRAVAIILMVYVIYLRFAMRGK